MPKPDQIIFYRTVRTIALPIFFLVPWFTSEAATTQTCAQYGTIGINGNTYIVQADEWGSTAAHCLTADTTTGDFTMDTSAIDTGNPGTVGSYPSIFRGCHWGNSTAGSGMPIAVSAITCLPTSWTVTPITTGVWNASYDIWFGPTVCSSGGSGNNGLELMIWLDWLGGPDPAGSVIASNVTIAGTTWNIWAGPVGSWTCVSYARVTHTDSISNLDIRLFMNDCIARGYLQNTWTLNAVEAGFELRTGGAGLRSGGFCVAVNPGSCTCSGVAGPTPTFTSTPTRTSTPTATRTMTATSTFSSTPSASPTRTPSATFSPTKTLTFTLTRTNTPTMTATVSPTATGTYTATFTPTFTYSRTSTPTPPFTLTATITTTFTRTSTVTFTTTPTFTRTSTTTFTAATTATLTPTSTHTDTQTFTPTSTWTGLVPTHTPTFSTTPTAAATRTFTATVTYTTTTTWTGVLPTSTLSPTPTVTETLTRTFTATATTTFTQTPTLNLTQTFTWTTTPTPSSTPTVTRTSTLVPTDSFTPTVTAGQTETFTPTASLTTTLTRTATSTRTYTSTFSETLTPSFTSTATFPFTPTSTWSRTPTPSPSVTATNTQTQTPSPTVPAWTSTPTVIFTQTGTCGSISISAPFPNPVKDEGIVRAEVSSVCPQTVHVSVGTVANRKLADFKLLVSGTMTVVWRLKDLKGKRVSSGVYYMFFQAEGQTRKALKMIVLR